MLFGIISKNNQEVVQRDNFESACVARNSIEGTVNTEYPNGSVAFANLPSLKTGSYRILAPVCSSDRGLAVVFSGQIYNKSELAGAINSQAHNDRNLTNLVLDLYRKYGHSFVDKVNGKFAYAIWDQKQGGVTLGRDRFGIEPLYYYCDSHSIIFASAIAPILHYRKTAGELNFSSVSKFLLFGYNPSLNSFYRDIHKLRPAHIVHFKGDNTPEFHQYWKLGFADVLQTGEGVIAEELREQLKRSVEIRIGSDEDYGVFVSGGMDSSSVLGLSAQKENRNPYTFSYRCRGESYDESPYARLMAKSVNSTHKEIEYTPDDVLSMSEIAVDMDEPFCDVGINIATSLLGKAAQNSVPYVLTGDGGDELFAGHPIYEADKIARFIDPIPWLLKKPIFSLASLLPDSDQKKNLTVKIKRFAESMSYPAELLSHRWRIYYQPADLRALLSDDAYQSIVRENLYDDILSRNREVQGLDHLSHSLYSDYNTVLDFYLRRNDINRSFGLETRYPMLDHELVEYCARIPMSLKIRGWFDTKYIFRKSMEPVLPHKIVHREDKLGHSIPLKNWLRDKPQVKEFILDHLSEETIRKRGYFNVSYINGLIDEHMSMKRNNSHRLWTLAVLEMWLRAHDK
jgi:asparagine synthase (glutamine-hydrolysing)